MSNFTTYWCPVAPSLVIYDFIPIAPPAYNVPFLRLPTDSPAAPPRDHFESSSSLTLVVPSLAESDAPSPPLQDSTNFGKNNPSQSKMSKLQRIRAASAASRALVEQEAALVEQLRTTSIQEEKKKKEELKTRKEEEKRRKEEVKQRKAERKEEEKRKKEQPVDEMQVIAEWKAKQSKKAQALKEKRAEGKRKREEKERGKSRPPARQAEIFEAGAVLQPLSLPPTPSSHFLQQQQQQQQPPPPRFQAQSPLFCQEQPQFKQVHSLFDQEQQLPPTPSPSTNEEVTTLVPFKRRKLNNTTQ